MYDETQARFYIVDVLEWIRCIMGVASSTLMMTQLLTPFFYNCASFAIWYQYSFIIIHFFMKSGYIVNLFDRKYKFESELNKMSWRIRSQDIIFAGRRGGSTVATRHGQQPGGCFK